MGSSCCATERISDKLNLPLSSVFKVLLIQREYRKFRYRRNTRKEYYSKYCVMGVKKLDDWDKYFISDKSDSFYKLVRRIVNFYNSLFNIPLENSEEMKRNSNLKLTINEAFFESISKNPSKNNFISSFRYVISEYVSIKFFCRDQLKYYLNAKEKDLISSFYKVDLNDIVIKKYFENIFLKIKNSIDNTLINHSSLILNENEYLFFRMLTNNEFNILNKEFKILENLNYEDILKVMNEYESLKFSKSKKVDSINVSGIKVNKSNNDKMTIESDFNTNNSNVGIDKYTTNISKNNNIINKVPNSSSQKSLFCEKKKYRNILKSFYNLAEIHRNNYYPNSIKINDENFKLVKELYDLIYANSLIKTIDGNFFDSLNEFFDNDHELEQEIQENDILISERLKSRMSNYYSIVDNLKEDRSNNNESSNNDALSLAPNLNNKMKTFKNSKYKYIKLVLMLSEKDMFYYHGGWCKISCHLNSLGNLYMLNDQFLPNLKYNGFFVNSNFNGVGNLTTNEKYYYTGEFIDGERFGYCEIVDKGKELDNQLSSSSIKYKGLNINSEFQGFGELIEKDYFYIGTFSESNKTGIGLYFNEENGIQYVGGFLNQKLNGLGYLKWIKNEISSGKGSSVDMLPLYYYGEFLDNVQNGFGKIYYSNGDSYTGEFRNGMFHGKGQYNYKSGKILKPLIDGQFINDKKSGWFEYKSNKDINNTTYILFKNDIQISTSKKKP